MKKQSLSLSTLARYADPCPRFTCPIVGIPTPGCTLIMPRRLLQTALDSPSIQRAYFNGDGRLHLEGTRARYAIALLTPDESLRGQIFKWAAARRRQIQAAVPLEVKKLQKLEKARLALGAVDEDFEAPEDSPSDARSSYNAVAEVYETARPAISPALPEAKLQETIFLVPAMKFGVVRLQARSLDAAIEAYDDGVADFDWQEDPGDDPELIRPAVASVEGSDEILEEMEVVC